MIHFQSAPHALSAVAGHEGPCIATWLNHSRLPLLGSKQGSTGFFRLCRRLMPGVYWTFGPEFHGGARWQNPCTIESTEDWGP